MTRQICRKDSLAPVKLETIMEIHGGTHEVRIEYLGLKEAWMVGKNLLGKKGDEVVLVLPVNTRDGEVKVRCEGEIISVDLVNKDLLSTLKLWINSCDEGSHKDVFRNYVRWLHFNVIRTT